MFKEKSLIFASSKVNDKIENLVFSQCRPIFIYEYSFQGKLGDLFLSLCYDSANSTIRVTIVKAAHLKAKDINGYSGSFVRPSVRLYCSLNKAICSRLLND